MTKNQLKPLSVYNAFGYASGRVYIDYHAGQSGRGATYPKWVVVHGKKDTDPEAHFLDYGRKVFTVNCRANKEPELIKCKDWASQKYGIKAWTKTPFGTWMEADFVKARNAELKAMLKALSK